MNCSDLPLELIDEILKHLDAISLAKSRQVCRTWLALHAQPKYKLLWRQACVRDIGYDVLTEITGDNQIFSDDNLGHSGATGKDGGQKNCNIDWKAIYQRWFRSRHIGKWPCMITELEGHSGKTDFPGSIFSFICFFETFLKVWKDLKQVSKILLRIYEKK